MHTRLPVWVKTSRQTMSALTTAFAESGHGGPIPNIGPNGWSAIHNLELDIGAALATESLLRLSPEFFDDHDAVHLPEPAAQELRSDS